MKIQLGFILLITSITTGMLSAQTQPMGLNQVPLQDLGNQPHYNFWVGGHIAGSSHRSNQSIYPAAGFVANTGMFDASAAQCVMLLGDSFTGISPTHADAMRRTLDQLPMPVINVMGKTEHSNRDTYEALLNQPANTQFMIGPDVFLVVDSFATDWSWLADRLQTISQTPALRHVFVFAARMPWGDDQTLPSLPTRREVSRPVTLPSAESFSTQIKPLLTRLAQIKNVYWFVGNIDSRHIHPNYYWQSPDSSLTIVATAMTGTANDSMLNVQVDSHGVVRIFPVNLSTGMITDIHEYTASRWESDTMQWRADHPRPGFYAYFKHKTKEVITSKKFAAGIFGGMVFGVLAMLIKRPTVGRKVRRPVAMPESEEDSYMPMPSPQPHDLFNRIDDDDQDDAEKRHAA